MLHTCTLSYLQNYEFIFTNTRITPIYTSSDSVAARGWV